MGQNFSWLEQIGHGLEQQGRRQRAGNLWDAVWRICVEDECTFFCEPIKGWSKTTKTCFCLLIYKNCSYLWKILDWYWARNLFACRLPSVKTTEYSSASWSSTSRQWWSDWILEIKRFSSERFCAISHVCLLEDKVQDRGMYLFAIFLWKRCNGSRKWSWLIQWMN